MKNFILFVLVLFIVAIGTIERTVTSKNSLILENIEALAFTEGPVDQYNPIQYYLEVKGETCYILEEGTRIPGIYYSCIKKSFLPIFCHTGCRISPPSI